MRAWWSIAVLTLALGAGLAALAVRERAASAPPVKVKVYDEGRPAAGRWVVFHDASGDVVSHARTDADGRASGAGRMVTVLEPGGIAKAVTVVDVEPNDELVFGEEEDEGGAAATACTAHVSVDAPHEAAPVHVVSLGVGETEVPDLERPLLMPVLTRYLAGGEFVVLAEALGPDREPIAFGHVTARCPDGGPAPVRVSPSSTEYRAFDVHVTHDGAGAVAGELAIVRGEDRFDRGHRTATLDRSADLRFRAPRPLGSDARLRLTIDRAGTDERVVIVQRRRAMPERATVDATMARPTDLAVDGRVPARPAVRWKVVGEPVADATLVRVWWPTSHEHEWTVVAPPGASGVRLPALPDELAAFRPGAATLSAAVMIVDASYVSGYGDVRARGLGVLEEAPHDADGTLRYARVGAFDLH